MSQDEITLETAKGKYLFKCITMFLSLHICSLCVDVSVYVSDRIC